MASDGEKGAEKPLDQTDALGRELPPSACPDCGYQTDAATSATKSEESRPSPGDVSICMRCSAFLRFDDNMHLVALTSLELRELPKVTRDMLHRARKVLHDLQREETSPWRLK